MKKALYYILFVLGVLLIFSSVIELIIGNISNVVGGFIGGIIFLLIAIKLKPNKKKLEENNSYERKD